MIKLERVFLAAPLRGYGSVAIEDVIDEAARSDSGKRGVHSMQPTAQKAANAAPDPKSQA